MLLVWVFVFVVGAVLLWVYLAIIITEMLDLYQPKGNAQGWKQLVIKSFVLFIFFFVFVTVFYLVLLLLLYVA